MYQYEHGVKKKNVGYARIEARNGQCKFTLHMQLLGQIDSIFPTYLIRRDGKEMDLIYLGDSPLKSQMLDSRIMSAADNVVDSGYGISDMGGMVIFLNDDLFYATEWDDRPIVASEVLAALKPKKSKKSNAIANKMKQDPIDKISIEAIEHIKQQSDHSIKEENIKKDMEAEQSTSAIKEEVEVTDQAIEKAPSNIEENEEEATDHLDLVGNSGIKVSIEGLTLAQIEDMIPKYKLPRGYKTLEGLQRDHYIFVESAKKDIQSIESGRKDILAAATIKEAGKEAIVQQPVEHVTIRPQKVIEKVNENPVATKVEKMVDKSVETKEDSSFHKKSIEKHTEDPESGKVTMSQIATEREAVPQDKKGSKMADYFFEKYPKMYPFEDSEVTLCVKIEPKDIGFLPNEFWSLSNNSFLLHGYYSHRHLIFAQINTQKGTRYILGVPGTFQGKERHMAKMFGFENFKSVRKRELRQGDFGYWCKFIQP